MAIIKRGGPGGWISGNNVDARKEKLSAFRPIFLPKGGRPMRIKGDIPGTMTGSSFMPTQSAGNSGTGTGQILTSTPMYYDPRFYTLDRFYFPRSKEQAYSIWELFYDRDPACGVAVDLFGDLRTDRPVGQDILRRPYWIKLFE